MNTRLTRTLALILLLLGSMLVAIPVTPTSNADQFAPYSSSSQSPSLDPDGTKFAFNTTFSQLDLYTNKTANVTPISPLPGGNLTWISRVNRTSDGMPLNGTGFIYTIDLGKVLVQSVNWTLAIPKGNYSATFLRFRWNGTVGPGTSARYLLFNGTDTTPNLNVTKTGNFTGGPPMDVTLPCGSNDECFNVSKFIGSTMRLAFVFASNGTGARGLKIQVVNIAVASVGTIPGSSAEHKMVLNPSNSAEVLHTTRASLTYNATERQPTSALYTWSQMATSFYFPSSYRLENITLPAISNTTNIAAHPLDKGTCTSTCTNMLLVSNQTFSKTQFVTLNMTFPYNVSSARTAVIIVKSLNAVESIQTTLAGVPTNFWTPGDKVGVRITNRPGVNVTGTQNVTLTDPNGLSLAPEPNPVGLSVRTGVSLYNPALPLTPLGNWTVTGTFLSGYDFGVLSLKFRVDEIRVQTGSFQMAGAAGIGHLLNIRGRLVYSSNSSDAKSVNATVFAIDAGSPSGFISSTAPTGSGQLFISNITLKNGVFTQNQPLILFFTVANPTPSTAFSANVTVDHEWYNGLGGSHGTNVTFPLTLGDEPFLSPSSVYRMDVSLTSGGTQLTVKSITTNNKVTLTLSTGTSGVSPSRQHFGSFKISVTSKPTGGGGETNFLRSPTYAYALHSSLIPSRLLGFSPTVATASDGSFSADIVADRLLGARKLVVFVLARDVNGIVLGKDQTATVTDSTLLIPTASIPNEVTVKQSVTITLNLRSNSTNLPITLTVNLDLSGSGTVATRTITIRPGTTQPAEFTFTAPAAAGSYLLTFSSPQYGAPLLPKTLNVVLLQSSLQILIPAIIGLVAALAILGFYLIRKQPETEMEEEKKRPSPGKPSKPQQGSSRSKSLTRS